MDPPYAFQSVNDVDTFAIENPDEYDRLLRGYFRLLGQRPTLWWQDDASAIDERWPRAVADSIAQVASASGVPVRVLADWLDDEALPKARTKILELARHRLA